MKRISLANLESATAQEVFDQVKTHLLKQNARSVSSEGKFCLYRSASGLSCAAGCLMADKEYREEMDDNEMDGGTAWGDLITRNLVPTTKHNNMIRCLQYIHDNHPLERWSSELKILANRDNLTF